MVYNIHPIFVHFPIALLFIYSIIKISPLSKWFPKAAWKDVERTLLVFGVAGAFVALSTGEIAEHLVRPNLKLIEAHATFASISTYLYIVLLLGECGSFLTEKQNMLAKLNTKILAIIFFVKKYLADSFISKSIAFIALITLALGGLLGGVIVYGVTADPLASFVLRLLGISL